MEKEKKAGVFSHFSSVLRFVAFLLLIAVVTFFVVRWVQNRQDVKEAQKAAGTSQRKNSDSDKNADEGESTVDVSKLPSGVADSNAQPDQNKPSGSGSSNTSVPSKSVPAAGMSIDSGFIAFGLMAVTYISVYVWSKRLSTERSVA